MTGAILIAGVVVLTFVTIGVVRIMVGDLIADYRWRQAEKQRRIAERREEK